MKADTLGLRGMVTTRQWSWLFGLISAGYLACGVARAAEEQLPLDLENPRASVPLEQVRLAQPQAFQRWLDQVREHAATAERAARWEQASELYKALSFALPHEALAFRKLCEIHEVQLKDLQQAEHYCWALVKRSDSTLADHYHFLDLALDLQSTEDKGGIKVRRGQMMAAVIDDLRLRAGRQPQEGAAVSPSSGQSLPLSQQAEVYACRFAASLASLDALSACLSAAEKAAVPQRSLLPFRWQRARLTGDASEQARWEHEAASEGLSLAALRSAADGPRTPRVGGPRANPGGGGSSPVAPTTSTADGLNIDTRDDSHGDGGGTENKVALIAALLGLATLVWIYANRDSRRKGTQKARLAD